MKSVLFVCFGNVCRSTIAEAIFLKMISDKGQRDQWLVDSAGHGNWHLGEGPSESALHVLKQNGIVGYTHKARLIENADYFKFDTILGMDDYNLRNLQVYKPSDSQCHVGVLGDFDPQGVRVIFDPYFSDSIESYHEVYRQCYRCCKAFLHHHTYSH